MSTKSTFGFLRGETSSIIEQATMTSGENASSQSEIWDHTPASGVSVVINTQRSAHRVVPEAMFFDLELSGFDTNTLSGEIYDPSYHDKYVFWDYEESYFFTAPTQVLAWDAADGGSRRDSRYSRGPLGSHTFRVPGQYTVRVAVLEPASGKLGFGSTNVSVGDPDTFYSGSTTLYVDTTGGFVNAIAGARRFTSLDSALAALDAATTPHRVVLENGQVFELNSAFFFRPPGVTTGSSFRIESRVNNGVKPIVRPGRNWQGDIFMADSSERDARADSGVVMCGIRFEGIWDTTTQTGTQLTCLFLTDTGARNVVLDQCEFSGWGINVYPIGARFDRVIALNDLSVSNWGNYGVFHSTSSPTSVTGCAIAQNVDARTGGPSNTSGKNNAHGPIRMEIPTKTQLWANDLFSNTGWSSYARISAIQACLRWNTTPKDSPTGCKLNMQACVCESGREAIVVQAQNTSNPRSPVNALIEANFLVPGFQAFAAMEVCFGGTTVRNNMMVVTDAPRDSTSIGGFASSIAAFVRAAGGAAGDPSNERTAIGIYNNTMLNLNRTQAVPAWQDTIGFADVDVENNLIHEPNLPSPNTPDTPLESTLAFTCRYKGYRANDGTLNTQFENDPASAIVLTPKIGSAALGAALEEPNACTDLQGDLRPEPPSRGATEAS